MRRLGMLPLILMLATGFASAEIEKTAATSDAGIQLWWWPKVQPPPGWHFDEGSSRNYGCNAMAPDGATFSNAETVMYAKADYKPRRPEIGSLAQLIDADIADFRQAYPGMSVDIGSPVPTADRQPLTLVTFTPYAGGSWESVAYGEDAEFYLMFTVSSRTEAGLAQAMPAFKAMVASYRVAP